jgi:hypothetical protein
LVEVELDAGQAALFIRDVLTFLGRRKGRLSGAVKTAVEEGMEELRKEGEDIARDILRSGRSGGPQLSVRWDDEKGKSWAGDRWYVSNETGMTVQAQQPPMATGSSHKGVWTGFLDSELTSWTGKLFKLGTTPEVFVGFRKTARRHPITGSSAVTIAGNLHMGFNSTLPNAKGKWIPPRPFLNTPEAMRRYNLTGKAVVGNMLQRMAMARQQ